MSGAAGKRHPTGKNHIRATLMSSLEEMMNREELINSQDFDVADDAGKIQLMKVAFEGVNDRFVAVHNIINDASDGLDPRVTDSDERITGLIEDNKQLRFELDILKGMFSKMETENSNLRHKVTALSAMTMKNNIIINGLTTSDESKEKPIDTVTEFLAKTMEVQHEKADILHARRLGMGLNPASTRPMLVTMTTKLRDTVMSKTSNLKDKTNAAGKYYRVSRQLPDQWAEENRKLREDVTKAKKVNLQKDATQEPDVIEVKKRVLYVNKKPQRKTYLEAPTAVDLFPDKNEQDKLDKIKFSSSSTMEEQGSTFTAYAQKVQSITEVRRAYVKVRQLHPSATHVVAAYSLKNCDGYQDDKEYGAGYRALNVINVNNYASIAVFIVRYHQGPNIGPKRHILMEKVEIEALARTKIKHSHSSQGSIS